MHKKLEADLVSLAHRILQMKNKHDVFALKEMSQKVYEKLSMLAFVEEYVNTNPNLDTTKEDLIEELKEAFDAKENTVSETKNEGEQIIEAAEKEEEKIIYDLVEDTVDKNTIEEETPKKETTLTVDEASNAEEKVEEEIVAKTEPLEQPFDELESLMFPPENLQEPKQTSKETTSKKVVSLEEELEDTISVDVMADLFENVQPKSLNDRLLNNIQIGLNDRITFVKNLFNGEQENYNRVISQLNTFKTEKEAKKFINKMVKPDYNWDEHEDLEERFMDIVSRKFS
ncbi:MAG: hypothetical protein HWD82_04700 [Flavobacteriaceae bacterium]|nr:hypothetical protein [Flavobacteriaceae bacterium]